jgi:hypothetical protein
MDVDVIGHWRGWRRVESTLELSSLESTWARVCSGGIEEEQELLPPESNVDLGGWWVECCGSAEVLDLVSSCEGVDVDVDVEDELLHAGAGLTGVPL